MIILSGVIYKNWEGLNFLECNSRNHPKVGYFVTFHGIKKF